MKIQISKLQSIMTMIKMHMGSGLKGRGLKLRSKLTIQEKSIELDQCLRNEISLLQRPSLEKFIFLITSSIRSTLKTMKSSLRLNWRDIPKRDTDSVGIPRMRAFYFQGLTIPRYAFGT